MQSLHSNESSGVSSWFYLDSIGQQFGPFANDTMRTWHSKGYFSKEVSLLVRAPCWSSFVSVESIWPNARDAFTDASNSSQLLASTHPGQTAGHIGADSASSCTPYSVTDHVSNDTTTALFAKAAEGQNFTTVDCMDLVVAGHEGMEDLSAGGGSLQGERSLGQRMQSDAAPGNSVRMQGIIKSFNSKQGFGFIQSQDAFSSFGRDVFLHKAQIGKLKVGAEVTYIIELNRHGMPQARDLLTLDGTAAHAATNAVMGSEGARHGRVATERAESGHGPAAPGSKRSSKATIRLSSLATRARSVPPSAFEPGLLPTSTEARSEHGNMHGAGPGCDSGWASMQVAPLSPAS
eukprot:gb/GFBE01017392.1/.p1 GENE.gb/GFBE01017392.1/~~gb/GFBE01017392.1/.p1  ORF type:complete len:348 (+),score=54.11 gb/GFBE01017392.1/:1-1044(+)